MNSVMAGLLKGCFEYYGMPLLKRNLGHYWKSQRSSTPPKMLT